MKPLSAFKSNSHAPRFHSDQPEIPLKNKFVVSSTKLFLKRNLMSWEKDLFPTLRSTVKLLRKFSMRTQNQTLKMFFNSTNKSLKLSALTANVSKLYFWFMMYKSDEYFSKNF